MSEENVRTRMQLLTQAAAFLLIVIYVVGFLTLSLHHASFGISLQYSLFRPRILSAGTIFIVLSALAMIAAAQMFELWSFNMPLEKTSQSAMRSETDGYRTFSLRVLSFLYFAIFLSFVIARYLFVDGYEWEDRFGV